MQQPLAEGGLDVDRCCRCGRRRDRRGRPHHPRPWERQRRRVPTRRVPGRREHGRWRRCAPKRRPGLPSQLRRRARGRHRAQPCDWLRADARRHPHRQQLWQRQQPWPGHRSPGWIPWGRQSWRRRRLLLPIWEKGEESQASQHRETGADGWEKRSRGEGALGRSAAEGRARWGGAQPRGKGALGQRR